MRRPVWRFDPMAPWTTYGMDRRYFGGRVATTGLEAAKREVATVTGHEPANEEKGVKRKESVDQKDQEMEKKLKTSGDVSEKGVEKKRKASGDSIDKKEVKKPKEDGEKSVSNSVSESLAIKASEKEEGRLAQLVRASSSRSRSSVESKPLGPASMTVKSKPK